LASLAFGLSDRIVRRHCIAPAQASSALSRIGLDRSGQLALDDPLNPAKMAWQENRVNIPLDRDKPTALPRQIQAHLERLIHERLLTPGMKLPATRELARQLGVNRGTVALAYEELVATGWARAHVGQGTFVAERAVPAGAAVAPPATPPVALDWSGLFSRSAQILGADNERSRAVTPIPSSGTVVSFAGGMPDSGLFPTDAFRRVLNQVIREEGASLLQYYPAGGYPPLRQYLSTYLLRFGLEARPDEILIVKRLAAGVRPDRPHADRSRRLRRHRAADVPACDAGLPVVRRAALERAVERRRAPRRPLRAASGAPHAQALLLPAERPQSDWAGGRAGDGAAAAGGGGAPSGADRRRRLRR
jgi:hypothetical protein